MATAQEILARIKENKRKENARKETEKLFRVGDSSSSCDIYTLPPTAANGSIYRLCELYQIESTLHQEESLYLHWQAKLLSIKLANQQKFILPLQVRRRQQVYRTLFPKFSMRLNSCTYYLPELVSYISLHCNYIQQLLDTLNEYLTGVSLQQQQVIYNYLILYKEYHDGTN